MNVIGVSCTSFSTRPPMEVLREVSRDFAHWEIFSELEHSVQTMDDPFFEAAADSGMSFSLHTSISDTDIAALSPRMREASVMEILTELECAASMDIDTVTVHPGLVCLAVSQGTRDRSIAAARESCRLIDRAAHEFRIENVCIENMPDFGFMLGIRAEELDAIVDGTELGITFDIGHANTACQIDAMIDTFGDRIANIHIHDNHGKDDEHLTIGDGTIDFKHVLGRLSNYKGRYIIESRNLESAVESQKRLREMLC